MTTHRHYFVIVVGLVACYAVACGFWWDSVPMGPRPDSVPHSKPPDPFPTVFQGIVEIISRGLAGPMRPIITVLQLLGVRT